MGNTIIKPKADEDFYVVYSSVVDTPTSFGTRKQLLSSPWANVDAVRLARADIEGTSALWGTPGQQPYGWQDTEVPVREGINDPTRPADAFWGMVKREDLRAFCESVRKGFFCPPPGLVRWETIDDDE